jgi:hypothetical protein
MTTGKWTLLALWLLGGCVNQQINTQTNIIPDDLTSCATVRPLPLPPPTPRTPQQLIDWAKKLQSVAIVNTANLMQCEDRLLRLNLWITERKDSR